MEAAGGSRKHLASHGCVWRENAVHKMLGHDHVDQPQERRGL
jgi:hypothetical protein